MEEETVVWFEPQERGLIQAYADSCGKSFSDFVREAALEKVEDAVDRAAYDEAVAADDGRFLSMDEVVRLAMADE